MFKRKYIKYIFCFFTILANYFAPNNINAANIIYVTNTQDAMVDSFSNNLNLITDVMGVSITYKNCDPGSLNDCLNNIFKNNLKIHGAIFNTNVLTNLRTLKDFEQAFNNIDNIPILYVDNGSSPNENFFPWISNNSGTNKVECDALDNMIVFENHDNNLMFSGKNFSANLSLMSTKLLKNLNSIPEIEVLEKIYCNNYIDTFPVYAKTQILNKEVFIFTTPYILLNDNFYGDWHNAKNSFLEYYPIFTFLKNSFKNKTWHNSNFANLTIDDPWLIEPYGNLSYFDLLKEMKKANFHTTIAFVPWNWNRNKNNIINLFNLNKNLYSIAIHGNNHYGQEFKNNLKNNLNPVNFKYQEMDISQALIRMESFKRSTGINFDKIMIFPHGISPQKTFTLLKKYNYIGTINSKMVPSDIANPAGYINFFRGYNDEFQNLPSLRRLSTQDSMNENINSYISRGMDIDEIELQIYMDTFLYNPICFYTHQEFFFHGISGFNNTALLINSIAPNIKWVSIGDIFKNLYLIREIDNKLIELKSFSGHITLCNNTKEKQFYNYFKIERNKELIQGVSLGKKSLNYDFDNDKLVTNFSLIPFQCDDVIINYKSTPLPVGEHSFAFKLKVRGRRYLSDIKNMYIMKNRFAARIYITIVKHYNFAIYMILFALVFPIIIIIIRVRTPNNFRQ